MFLKYLEISKHTKPNPQKSFCQLFTWFTFILVQHFITSSLFQFLMTPSTFTEHFPGLNKVHYPITAETILLYCYHTWCAGKILSMKNVSNSLFPFKNLLMRTIKRCKVTLVVPGFYFF